MSIKQSPLGKKSAYIDQYSPDLLFPIARKTKRDEIGVSEKLPFYGYDLWNGYEISWLNSKGKPIVATAELIIPAESSHLIESKSLKLYFNSFNQTKFLNECDVKNHMIRDLTTAARSPVSVQFISVLHNTAARFENLHGLCLDDLDVQVECYQPKPELLTIENKNNITESVHSHLLRSNCPITGQPDWGSIEITYSGPKINHEGLLRYLVSLRNHNEFHEQCIERIFITILQRCEPTELTVYARYTRRGGLDINPYRSTQPYFSTRNPRLIRQ